MVWHRRCQPRWADRRHIVVYGVCQFIATDAMVPSLLVPLGAHEVHPVVRVTVGRGVWCARAAFVPPTPSYHHSGACQGGIESVCRCKSNGWIGSVWLGSVSIWFLQAVTCSMTSNSFPATNEFLSFCTSE
ncbi:uncharacterized protein BT62DRAFT_553470 [Guyanagaster necrorhizus]|uniref:Uncharacterized protein n=1 Tax=Guyanagaster necrorhizus TaxID=856835 RepID=A0A9P8AMY1_9AGAR|nr:uncharacterized protein BT62DRAFT_553470 [Guyanagaster necrorhizus MCA 3950]KAG7441186.1 hypothetical protein BT62DRAFT_553470 [Guyanagaster necrorhizus MCA 3950]